MMIFIVTSLTAVSTHADDEPPPIQIHPCTAEQQMHKDCPASVMAMSHGWVLVESARSLQVGQRFFIVSQRLIKTVDPTTGQTVLVPRNEPTGMLMIERVRGGQGLGRLARNAYAEVGDLAVPTERPFRGALIYGPRFPRTWRIASDVWIGPLLNIHTGLGLVSRINVEYRFGPPIKLAVELGPGAVVQGIRLVDHTSLRWIDDAATFTGGVRGVVGLALSGFEVSAGFGGAVSTGMARSGALQMGLTMRAGSLDGFNVTFDSTFFLPAIGRPLAFDSFIGTINIPVHRSITLALLGGGGWPMWGLTTVSLRSYVSGTGGPGTIILQTGIGFLIMALRKECPPPTTSNLTCVAGDANDLGPVLQLGLDVRL